MSIHWETYQKTHTFSLLEAAFLWLEIEPTKEGLESPSHPVEARRKLLNDEINRYYKEWMYLSVHSLMQTGISEDEAFDQYIRSAQENFVENMREWGLTEQQIIEKKEQICKTLITKSDRFKLQFEDTEINEVSSNTLREIAKKLDERPKFLFPEIMIDIAGVTPSDNVEIINTKRRNSYLKLIKGLLHDREIDPGERGIAKGLEGMVKAAKQSLGDDVIRDILKEVQDLEEDD
jgi:hypothetical protein